MRIKEAPGLVHRRKCAQTTHESGTPGYDHAIFYWWSRKTEAKARQATPLIIPRALLRSFTQRLTWRCHPTWAWPAKFQPWIRAHFGRRFFVELFM